MDGLKRLYEEFFAATKTGEVLSIEELQKMKPLEFATKCELYYNHLERLIPSGRPQNFPDNEFVPFYYDSPSGMLVVQSPDERLYEVSRFKNAATLVQRVLNDYSFPLMFSQK
jgi:hypothetical protein